jgi:phospholipase C
VPAIVVSDLARARVVHHGPFEHTSTLKLIESTFGLQALTARDANARNLGDVLSREARRPVPPTAIPASSEVPGPANDAAAVCGIHSVPSVSPPPAHRGQRPPGRHVLAQSGSPTGSGMAGFGRKYRQDQAG